MKPRDYFALSLLFAFAAFIWLRDPAWIAAADETLPILAGLPLFIWLGAPWRFRTEVLNCHAPALVLAGIMLVLGVATNLTLLLTISWTAALWSWLQPRTELSSGIRMRQLLVLPILAFPWLLLDFPQLGWWCRLSAAWTAEHVFHSVGFEVARQGTQLVVQGLPIDITPACSGLRALQAMLIAGVTMAFLQLGGRRTYWWGLATLPLLAWVANTARVLVISVVALSFGPEFAGGWFHEVGGWCVLAAMFALCGLAFSICRKYLKPKLAQG
ncbi:MAG: exosortase/archaeosortase family protein [Verrucomicrobiota bacterium]